ncbi:GYF domain-containing protein [uncultured Paracoccus sp.]|nr:GYF domain-containing protein [uncultured Paracoccus sp.]
MSGDLSGDLSRDDIMARIAEGTPAPETPVWKQEMPDWQAAKKTE